jgi:hypothetical protein
MGTNLSLTPIVEAVGSSDTLIPIYQNKQRFFPTNNQGSKFKDDKISGLYTWPGKETSWFLNYVSFPDTVCSTHEEAKNART